jgi:hypothetical protein
LETFLFVKEHNMPAIEFEKRFKSPIHKLLSFFERSRDGWKEKCKTAKATVKRLKNQTTKLFQSRQRWKELARQREQELEQVRRELEAQKS